VPSTDQAPNIQSFLVPNVSHVMLDLDHWDTGSSAGNPCPITNFAIRYRVKDLNAKTEDLQARNSWILVTSHRKPDYGPLFIRDLLPATWYELAITASNQAGDTETRYLFATLTATGATVEPLHFDALGQYNRRHLGSMIGGVMSAESLLEDPMILIPATCAILVLLVVGAATAFIFITRSKEALANSDHCKLFNYFSPTKCAISTSLPPPRHQSK